MMEIDPLLVAASAPALIAAAFSVGVWYRLGKMNGSLKQHNDELDHIKAGCPLWGNKTHENEPH